MSCTDSNIMDCQVYKVQWIIGMLHLGVLTWWRGAGEVLPSGHCHRATAERCRMNSIALEAPAANSCTAFSACSTVHTACDITKLRSEAAFH